MALTRGSRLKLAREYHTPRLTQESVAPLFKIDRSTLSKYENDEIEPPLDFYPMAAIVYKVREEYFFDPNVDGPPLGYQARLSVKEEPAQYSEGSKAAQGIAKGDKVFLRTFRGVTAGLDGDDEAAYIEEETPRAVWAFITGGDTEQHDILIVRGNSMHDRIESGSEVVVNRQAIPMKNDIVVARDPDGRTFIKVLKIGNDGREMLVSKNAGYPQIENLAGWEIVACAVAILSPTEQGSTNIEFSEGRTLKG